MADKSWRYAKRCDDCRLAKAPIVYLTTSRKICMQCWQIEKKNKKNLIDSLMFIVPWEAPLGYHFVINEWFTDGNKGRKMTDWVYDYFGSANC